MTMRLQELSCFGVFSNQDTKLKEMVESIKVFIHKTLEAAQSSSKLASELTFHLRSSLILK